jgi:hypothetical protein
VLAGRVAHLKLEACLGSAPEEVALDHGDTLLS